MVRSVLHDISLRVARFRSIAIGLGVAAACAVGPARAITIFDNETGLSSAGGEVVGQYAPGEDFALGFSFTAPTDGFYYALTGGSFGGSWDSGPNWLQLSVALDNGGLPGTVISSTTLNNELEPNLSLAPFTLPWAELQPGATYWLLASVGALDTRIYWWTADVPPGAVAKDVSYNGNPYTAGSDTHPGMFSITAAAVVPEPSTWALLLAGVAAVGLAARARSRRAAAPA